MGVLSMRKCEILFIIDLKVIIYEFGASCVVVIEAGAIVRSSATSLFDFLNQTFDFDSPMQGRRLEKPSRTPSCLS